MKRFLLLLRQLAVEFDAFADSAEADALMVVLNGIALPLADADGKPVAGSRPAGDFLAAASRILLMRNRSRRRRPSRLAGRRSTPVPARHWRAHCRRACAYASRR
ncbi:hypothetical protein [Candidatus Accumulibacter sp. ACC005]|uniref:hypothetical protein n=1 Tax=Candidatus Accumulibacter sp. ACC005 TaxID=2823331 RepID=UPI0025C14D61|nr:hypothetical protein [Candidatus Accumulibacter sp. ACC005]